MRRRIHVIRHMRRRIHVICRCLVDSLLSRERERPRASERASETERDRERQREYALSKKEEHQMPLSKGWSAFQVFGLGFRV